MRLSLPSPEYLSQVDQIDFAAFDLLHHLRELRTVKVRAGITVIRKLRPLTVRADFVAEWVDT